jgi:hypothetical protein
MSLRSRLERLEELVRPQAAPEPVAVALFDDECIAFVGGAWINWPVDKPVPRYCKLYLFDPRGI